MAEQAACRDNDGRSVTLSLQSDTSMEAWRSVIAYKSDCLQLSAKRKKKVSETLPRQRLLPYWGTVYAHGTVVP